MEKSKVYVVNFSGHDMSPATKYGEMVVLTKDLVNIFATDRIEHEFTKKLVDFNADIDFILLTGPIILNCLVTTILFRKFSKINVLIYHFNKTNYQVRTLRR